MIMAECLKGEYLFTEFTEYIKKTQEGTIVFKNNDLDIKEAIAKKNLRPTLPTNTHPILIDVITSCWKYAPDERYNASEVVEKLSQLNKIEYFGIHKEPHCKKKMIFLFF